LREFSQRRSFTISKEYVDHVTGNIEKRRRDNSTKDGAYQELMRDARQRKFDCVVVWKFDRFARSLPALIEALQEFSALGIDFISSTQDVDTTTPMGRLFFHLVGAFAEFERALIVERVNAGLANARAKGVQLGRPRNADVEARVLSLAEEFPAPCVGRLSLSAIAAQVGRSRAGVRQILMRAGKYGERAR
jgi:DNA invertase Pin-like site-specific DNA recombinase